MQSSKDNSPQYLLEVSFDRFVPKNEEKGLIFIKWKTVKTNLTKFNEHDGCFVVNEELRMLITLGNTKKFNEKKIISEFKIYTRSIQGDKVLGQCSFDLSSLLSDKRLETEERLEVTNKNEEKGQLRLKLKITPWLSVQDKEFYSIGPAKDPKPSADEDDELIRDPVYVKFIFKLKRRLSDDKEWPNNLIEEKDRKTSLSYINAMVRAKSQIVDSILEKYSDEFTDEEKKFLKTQEFENFGDDIIDFLILQVDSKVTGKDLLRLE